jgi:L-threonylcarbamoyladenylate synthase
VTGDLDGRIDLIIDGGRTSIGVESSIVDCCGEIPILLRPGGLARAAIEGILGRPLARSDMGGADDAPAAPGMLASHYAPRAHLRLDAGAVREGEALLAFGPELPRGVERAIATLNLSARGDLVEAAANLFGHLRALDASGARTIAAMPVPPAGLGEAINDRLRRAAAPRK